MPSNGKFSRGRNVQNHFFLQKKESAGIVWYENHTDVSQLQGLGVDMETTKSIVGHAEIDMTQHYLLAQDPLRKNAVTSFSDTFVDLEEEERMEMRVYDTLKMHDDVTALICVRYKDEKVTTKVKSNLRIHANIQTEVVRECFGIPTTKILYILGEDVSGITEVEFV